MLNALDTVMAFAAVMLLLSLLVQAVQEMAKTLLRWRSRQIRRVVRCVLADGAAAVGQGPAAALGGSLAAEVESRLVALGRKKVFGSGPWYDGLGKADLLRILNTVDPGRLGGLALDQRAGVGLARSQLEAVIARVDTLFDTALAAAQRRYARTMRWWAFGIAFGVCLLLKANAITIYERLAADPAVRAAVVEYARRAEERAAPRDSAALARTLRTARAIVRQYSVFGWDDTPSRPDLGRRVVGLLVATILVGLGAPFWHDALETLFGVKNALRAKAAW